MRNSGDKYEFLGLLFVLALVCAGFAACGQAVYGDWTCGWLAECRKVTQ